MIINMILTVAMQITPDTLQKALSLLGELIVLRDHPPQRFVVCVGSSLLALGLVSRTTTQDVDVLARMEDGNLVTPRPLPEWLLALAAEVGQQLALPERWFNDRVAEDTLFSCGLPDGMRDRLTLRNYGLGLRIGFISRRDQIFFKLHAAVDRDGGRHLQDLMDLQPTDEELRAAAEWTQTQDPSEGVLFNLRMLLKEISHDASGTQR
jgi:hypothetical protein